MPARLNIAVAGAGAFGRNHLRVYRDLEEAAAGSAGAAPPVHLAAIVDSDPQAGASLREEW
ncbi:MAG TPA: gfo/Idh/MocA family oxidoreductase, partial [Acidobacteriaceae bacterium]|nr:gfo/Idh/MocA family oxidoreductase [Acidobacteriaceae bacterium]